MARRFWIYSSTSLYLKSWGGFRNTSGIAVSSTTLVGNCLEYSRSSSSALGITPANSAAQFSEIFLSLYPVSAPEISVSTLVSKQQTTFRCQRELCKAGFCGNVTSLDRAAIQRVMSHSLKSRNWRRCGLGVTLHPHRYFCQVNNLGRKFLIVKELWVKS